MKIKIARNGEQFSKNCKSEHNLSDSSSFPLNASKKQIHIKLRLKENKTLMQRPKVPHNTTQYLSSLNQRKRSKLASLCKSSVDSEKLVNQNDLSIDDYIVTGGSLKGNKLFLINLYKFSYLLIK
jgi:hypothetical protein